MELLTAAEVAKILKIKKYTVYELIKHGEIPASRVGKQVRVSREDIASYLTARKSGGGRVESSGEVFSMPPPASFVLCGQDVCLELLVAHAASRAVPLLRSYMGSYNGLCALYNRRVSMTAAHLWDAATNTYNAPYIPRLCPGVDAGALRLVGRTQGFYVAKGNPHRITGWEDLARPEVRLVNRERGSGTRILLDQKLQAYRITPAAVRGYERECTTHLAVAGVVGKGEADVGVGCALTAAALPEIDFVPLQLEWYDLIYRLEERGSPALAEIIDYVQGGIFAADAAMLGAYDVSQTGRLL